MKKFDTGMDFSTHLYSANVFKDGILLAPGIDYIFIKEYIDEKDFDMYIEFKIDLEYLSLITIKKDVMYRFMFDGIDLRQLPNSYYNWLEIKNA